MTFPACDVHLLQNIVAHLERDRLKVYRPGTHRHASALLLRFASRNARLAHSLQRLRVSHTAHISPSSSSSCSITPTQAMQWMAARVDDANGANSALELLFVRRRMASEAPRWGGCISFAGGVRDRHEDVDDMHTLQRELRRLFGFTVADLSSVILLGRMPDLVQPGRGSLSLLRPLYRHTCTSNNIHGSSPHYRSHTGRTEYVRHTSEAGDDGDDEAQQQQAVIHSRFVYLVLDPSWTPGIQPTASHEVDRVRWLSLAPLMHNSHRSAVRGTVSCPAARYVEATGPDTRWLVRGPLQHLWLRFPCVYLPCDTNTGDVLQDDNNNAETWQVWGMPLRTLSELLQYAGYSALDWPLLSCRAWWLRLLLVYPLHGYYELVYQCYKLRGWRRRWHYLRRCQANNTRSTTATSTSAQPVMSYNLYDARQSVLPPAASPLLYAVPEHLSWPHVLCFLAVCALLVDVLYELACVVASTTTLLCMAFDLDSRADARRAAVRQYMRGYASKLGILAKDNNDKAKDTTHISNNSSSEEEEDDEERDDTAHAAAPLPEWDYAHEVHDVVQRYL